MIYCLTITAFSNMTSPIICRLDSDPVKNSCEFENTWLAEFSGIAVISRDEV